MGPLQLVIHVVQNLLCWRTRNTLEQDKQKAYITYMIENGNFRCCVAPLHLLLSSMAILYHANDWRNFWVYWLSKQIETKTCLCFKDLYFVFNNWKMPDISVNSHSTYLSVIFLIMSIFVNIYPMWAIYLFYYLFIYPLLFWLDPHTQLLFFILYYFLQLLFPSEITEITLSHSGFISSATPG